MMMTSVWLDWVEATRDSGSLGPLSYYMHIYLLRSLTAALFLERQILLLKPVYSLAYIHHSGLLLYEHSSYFIWVIAYYYGCYAHYDGVTRAIAHYE